MSSLTTLIVTQLDGELRGLIEKQSEIAGVLDPAWDEQAAAAAVLGVDVTIFAESLASKLTRGSIEVADLVRLRVLDLALAIGCERGDTRAIERFEADVLVAVARSIQRMGKTPTDADDVLQNLREKLFVGGADGRRKICDYNGTGSLFSWTRVAAVRDMQNYRRSTARESQVDSSDIWERLLPPGDTELEQLKLRYQEGFRAALVGAVARLSDRERILLRQHFVDGVPSSQIGALYRVHRATASRWIVSAQESLLAAVRTQLCDDLQIADDELQSVLRLIQSHFDTGIGELLAK